MSQLRDRLAITMAGDLTLNLGDGVRVHMIGDDFIIEDAQVHRAWTPSALFSALMPWVSCGKRPRATHVGELVNRTSGEVFVAVGKEAAQEVQKALVPWTDLIIPNQSVSTLTAAFLPRKPESTTSNTGYIESPWIRLNGLPANVMAYVPTQSTITHLDIEIPHQTTVWEPAVLQHFRERIVHKVHNLVFHAAVGQPLIRGWHDPIPLIQLPGGITLHMLTALARYSVSLYYLDVSLSSLMIDEGHTYTRFGGPLKRLVLSDLTCSVPDRNGPTQEQWTAFWGRLLANVSDILVFDVFFEWCQDIIPLWEAFCTLVEGQSVKLPEQLELSIPECDPGGVLFGRIITAVLSYKSTHLRLRSHFHRQFVDVKRRLQRPHSWVPPAMLTIMPFSQTKYLTIEIMPSMIKGTDKMEEFGHYMGKLPGVALELYENETQEPWTSPSHGMWPTCRRMFENPYVTPRSVIITHVSKVATTGIPVKQEEYDTFIKDMWKHLSPRKCESFEYRLHVSPTENVGIHSVVYSPKCCLRVYSNTGKEPFNWDVDKPWRDTWLKRIFLR